MAGSVALNRTASPPYSDGELVWFEGQLSQLGLEVYRQNYSATKLVNFQQEVWPM